MSESRGRRGTQTISGGFEEGERSSQPKNAGGQEALRTALCRQPARKLELSPVTTRN